MLKKIIIKLVELIQSIVFNVLYLSIKDALRLPIYVHYGFPVMEMHRGIISFSSDSLTRFSVHLGAHGSIDNQSFMGGVRACRSAKIIFGKNVHISSGTYIRLDKSSSISFGDNFWCNNNCLFKLDNEMTFGKNVLIGWNTTFNTTDGHFIVVDGQDKINTGRICIGNNVWVSSYVTCSKNSVIPDGCVVAHNSFINKSFSTSNSLIAGIPAQVIKSNIFWRK